MSLLSRWRVLAVAIVAALSLSGCGYNTIPTLEENAKAKWSVVQSQYQRRADLIPNLVATVQGYAKQEKDVLTSVVEARAKATSVKVDASLHHRPREDEAVPGGAGAAFRRAGPAARGDAKPIRTSSPTRTSLRCSRSSKARRTVSMSRGATT